MLNVVRKYREDPFFRSTINVIAVQAIFVLLSFLVFATSIWYQEYRTSETIDARRAIIKEGYRLTPESLDAQIGDIRNDTIWQSLIALIVLAGLFGYFTARYALQPTRTSLEYQKRFIGNIAHELRTPLAIIRTNTEVALMDKTLSDYSQSTFTITLGELDRVSGIINNLLSLDALTRPGRIRFERVDLRAVAEEVVARHKSMAHTYGIALALDAREEPSYVHGNHIALEQALTNLVKNALNYTPQHDGRSVVLRVDENEDTIVASVIDTGIGIAQQDLYYIFQPYFRGDTSRTRAIGSGTSGLGLAIVNDIVRAHNGSIVIRSALNRGTTIELSFPKVEDPNAVDLSSRGEDDGELHEEHIS
jgi:signal transduction histidine kinase